MGKVIQYHLNYRTGIILEGVKLLCTFNVENLTKFYT